MTTFVLIPGAGGSAWYWHLLVPELRHRGHEAIAVDLPASDDSAGLAAYTDAVVAAIGDAQDPVVVAQSMGALIGPLVCERLRVPLLVLLNPMVATPGETGHQWWVNTGHGDAAAEEARRNGQPVELATELRYAFFHDVAPHVTATAMAADAPDQSSRPFEDPWPLPAWPQVRTRVLQGRDDRFFPVAFQRRVVGERLGLPIEEMDGGHLLALSRPAELADRLVAYLDDLR